MNFLKETSEPNVDSSKDGCRPPLERRNSSASSLSSLSSSEDITSQVSEYRKQLSLDLISSSVVPTYNLSPRTLRMLKEGKIKKPKLRRYGPEDKTFEIMDKNNFEF